MYWIYFWDLSNSRWILTGNVRPEYEDINTAYDFANRAADINGGDGRERTRWRYTVVEEKTDMRNHPAPTQT